MKRFRFSLETVLRVRRQVEEARQRELAAAQAERDQCLMRLGGIQNGLRSLLADRVLGRTGRVDLNEELWFGGRQASLIQGIAETRALLADKEAALDKARVRAVEAARDRRVLEKLEESQYQDHLLKVNREEQGLLDDLAQRAVSALKLSPPPAAAPEALAVS